jgi:hypothetical protein
MAPSSRVRRKTTFGAWVHGYGAARLANNLGLSTRWPVYQWLAGSRVPRPALALRMVTLAGGWITLGDIYAQRAAVKGNGRAGVA